MFEGKTVMVKVEILIHCQFGYYKKFGKVLKEWQYLIIYLYVIFSVIIISNNTPPYFVPALTLTVIFGY